MKAYIIDKRLEHYIYVIKNTPNIPSFFLHCLLISEGFLPLNVASHTIKFQSLRPISDIVSCLLRVSMIPIVWWASSTYSLQQNDAFKFYPIIQNDPRGEIWERRRRKTTQEQKAECSNLVFLGTKYHTKTGFQHGVQVNRLTAHPKEN